MRKWFPMLVAALLLNLLPAAPLIAAEALNFSCSAQVARAFGKPLMQAFMEESAITVHTHISSSNLAISRLLNGFSQIAGSARPLRSQEVERGLIEIPICRDPLAVIVHRDCAATSLTTDQVRRLFNGEIDNWKEICGKDQPVTAIVPGKDTSVFETFREQAMRMNDIRYDFMTWKSTAAVEAVRYMPGAISFIGHVAAMDEADIRMLAIDGKSVTDADYPYKQTFSLVTLGRPSQSARAFIDFALSDQVTNFIVTHDMIPVIE